MLGAVLGPDADAIANNARCPLPHRAENEIHPDSQLPARLPAPGINHMPTGDELSDGCPPRGSLLLVSEQCQAVWAAALAHATCTSRRGVTVSAKAEGVFPITWQTILRSGSSHCACRPTRKKIHYSLHGAAALCVGLGVTAAFKSHRQVWNQACVSSLTHLWMSCEDNIC